MNRSHAQAALESPEIEELAIQAHQAFLKFMVSITPRDLILRATLAAERGRFSLRAVATDLRDQAAGYEQSSIDLEAYNAQFDEWLVSDVPQQQARPSIRRPVSGIKAGKRRKKRR